MLREQELCPGAEICPYGNRTELACDECPREKLGDYLASPAGRLIANVIDLDFALQRGIGVELNTIPYVEFMMLRQLSEERDRYQEEQMKKR